MDYYYALSIGKYKKFYISFYKDSSNGHKDNIKESIGQFRFWIEM